jgi:tetratricopeptide (TPR) repeat protein
MLNRARSPWIVFGGLIVAGILLYQIPAVQSRLAWRYERTVTYVRALVHPAGPVPTALPVPTEDPSAGTPTASPSPSPTPPATSVPAPTIPPLPAQVALTSPEWEREDMNNCGPATLSMALHMYGWQGDQFDISKVIKPDRADRNVNPDELAYWVRNYAGWLRAEYRVNGDLILLKRLLAAGYPVMIETTFRLDPKDSGWLNDDLWAAHYKLLTAYDDTARSFTLQDAYHGADQVISYEELEASWKPFNHVYFLIYLPDEEAELQSIIGDDWDPDINYQNALTASRAATTAHPDDKFAWFNYGTNLVAAKNYEEAARAYDTARSLDPLPQRMFRYQFGPFLAYFHSNRNDDLLELTGYALQITYKSEEAWLWQGWGLYRKGDAAGAINAWQRALALRNGDYPDAQYALDYARQNP